MAQRMCLCLFIRAVPNQTRGSMPVGFVCGTGMREMKLIVNSAAILALALAIVGVAWLVGVLCGNLGVCL